MAVLTISRDIGSGGIELARRVAELANYRIADKVVIEHVMREYGFVNFEKSYEASGGFWNAEEEMTERTLSFLDRVIRAVAKTDNVVIVGRGGFAPLSGFADAIHVRATAPFAMRVDRIMRERGMASRVEAERFVEKRDKSRRNFVARYYGAHWEDTSHFDLAADVDTFGVGSLAELLSDTLLRIDKAEKSFPSVRDIDVDRILLDAAQKWLAEHQSQILDD